MGATVTLRDVGEWFSGFWQALERDVQTVFSENVLDWLSIGIETGPLIGAQTGPLCSDVSWPEAA